MHYGIVRTSMWAAACILLMFSAGCASTGGNKPVEPVVQQVPLFPPQSVMQSGEYAAFLKENENILKTCTDPEQCATALFNICFLYSYSKSPYYNPVRAQLYFQDLMKGAPESAWAYQARIWIDIMKKSARKETKKRSAKEEAKSKDSASGEGARLVETAQENSVSEPDRQQLENEIRTRDETIRELTRQLERSRQIDIEIEKKQRHLPF